LAARIHTILHTADVFAASGTIFTDLGAFTADVLVMLRVDKHKMRAGSANLSARQHDFEVLRLHMFAACFEAVVHRHTKAGLVTAQSRVDAGLHLGRDVLHGRILVPVKSPGPDPWSAKAIPFPKYGVGVWFRGLGA
jgi:hypothetical protein